MSYIQPTLAVFSDPEAACPCGYACGTPLEAPYPAHAVLALNQVRETVAAFRPAKTEPGGSFDDVAEGYWAREHIEKIFAAGITKGCAENLFCPEELVTRAQMAAFLERGLRGGDYVPPEASGIFDDVSTSHWASDWIEQLHRDGITAGCRTAPLSYCPESAVTRAQMAIFLMRTLKGPGFVPPPAEGLFSDVSLDHYAAAWIEALYREGITTGCGTAPLAFCPESPVTRAQMAVFLARTFDL